MAEQYDVVVVGGGPAGLAGALTLARARRSVLVVDAGAPRNASAGHVHNYLGRDGSPPRDLLAIGRTEVTGYSGEIVEATVISVQSLGGPQGSGFRVTLANGRVVRARRLLVATGLEDELPNVTGVAERWGRDVFYCPYCHGWEVRDQPIAVIGSGPFTVHHAQLWRQWSAEVTFCRHTSPKPTGDELESLAARNIKFVDGKVAALEVIQDRLTGIRLDDGESIRCHAVVVEPRFTARAAVLAHLGLEPAERQIQGHLIGSTVPAALGGATAVPGVWVAGNVADIRAQAINAAAAGLDAAVAINGDLIVEDIREARAAISAEQHG
jgi:thioredoxin reductase